MRIIKIIIITALIFVALIVGLFTALLARVPSRLTKMFSSISIVEATRLAENCQIKSIGEQHVVVGKFITLTNGSSKYLEDKYQEVNHYRVYSDDYNHFFELLHNSESKCGFRVQSFIE